MLSPLAPSQLHGRTSELSAVFEKSYFLKHRHAFGFLLKGGLLLVSLLLSNYTYCQHKTLVYDIIRRNETIGTVQASQLYEGPQTSYHIESHVAIRLFTDIKVDVCLNSNYLNGMMKDAWMRKTINGSDKTNNYILKGSNAYFFVNKNGDTSSLQAIITNSIATLYFSEPTNIEKIFSENFLRFVPLQFEDSGTYKIVLPDGHVNHYTYQNGLCTQVVMETQLSTVFLKLRSITNSL